MNGSVFKRKYRSGRVVWSYSVDIGVDGNGNRVRESKSGFKRQGDAEEALRKVLYQLDSGEKINPAPTTFAELLENWFREYAERHCSLKTVERYRQLADYILPHIGAVKLTDLSPLILQRTFNEIKDRGGHYRTTKERRPLSVKTIRNIASVIHSALETAIEWNLIKTNPCTKKTVPRLKARQQGTALSPEQVSWYSDAARAHGLYEFLAVGAATGCRRGELLALTWSDVDFETPCLKISKSLEQTKLGLRVKATKTDKPRNIPLPASTVQILRDLRAKQEQSRGYFRTDYRIDLDLVFCRPSGDHLKPDSISAKASLIAKQAGLDKSNLHTLRHSYGSLLLSAGVPLPTVSKLLGRSSTFVTATIYSHAIPKDEAAAAETWDAIVQPKIDAEKTRHSS